jgi:hypothetical protein
MPSKNSNHGYTYRGEVADVDGNKTIYVSNDKKGWFGVNGYCAEVYPDGVEQPTCSSPCVFIGETYYYNYRESKWMTLKQMGIEGNECPDLSTFCDAHNDMISPTVTCASYIELRESCDPDWECRTADDEPCNEGDEGCICPPDYCAGGDLECSDYPFTSNTPLCTYDGEWQYQF